MRRFTKLKNIAFLCSVLLIGGFVIGFVLTHEGSPDKLQKLNISELGHQNDNEEPEEMPVDRVAEDRISGDTRLIFKSHYTECGDVVVERKEVPREIVGYNLEMLENYYSIWEIERFGSDEVIMVREIEGISPNHYLLGVQDGYVAIYGFGEDGKPLLKEITDVPVSILRLNDQHDLRKGILLDNMDEVNQFLEEFGS